MPSSILGYRDVKRARCRLCFLSFVRFIDRSEYLAYHWEQLVDLLIPRMIHFPKH